MQCGGEGTPVAEVYHHADGVDEVGGVGQPGEARPEPLLEVRLQRLGAAQEAGRRAQPHYSRHPGCTDGISLDDGQVHYSPDIHRPESRR